ncbi:MULTISPECIES: hypothetical protein [Paenibacillus]|uniref:DUF7336 domain-containing protein n=1 Tax=Paenibacillus TaxID=44249 RepID=UPI00020D7644|nr:MULTISPECIES: hypothetical protein [Paenibacillus]EGL15030.1 hypothetical protein HMPREF9413_2058 [Paenibacillus sp. HGF7]EPD82210.1 hypothetical protein HMPREF1207_04036 [Paenibacillus sp. HGH0039]GKS09261.1 hypothetical protein YDYSY3_02610 [Paenibacillus chitinolyticus]
MKTVFLLQHSYEINQIEYTKTIGIYSTRDKAQDVINKYKELPGFKEYPEDFYIDEYHVDKNEWQEGFLGSSAFED